MSGLSRDGAGRSRPWAVLLQRLCVWAAEPRRGENAVCSQTLCGRERTIFFWRSEGWHRHGGSHITAALLSWSARHLISISFLSSLARGLTLYIRWKASSRKIYDWVPFVISEAW